MAYSWGNSANSDRLYFGGSIITADADCSHEIKRRLLLGRKFMTNHKQLIKKAKTILPTRVCLFNAVVFAVVTYGGESWTVNRAEHRRIDAFDSPLDSKEIQPIHPKGNQSCLFTGRTDTEAETTIQWPPDAKN